MNKTKKILAFCLAMSMMLASFSMAFADDVDTDTDTSSVELDTIRLLGIMNGDENGDLNLDANVTRSAFIKMAVAASVYKDYVGDNSNLSIFSDVSSTHWAAGYIKEAVDLAWITGYLDGTFKPDNNITLEEGATVALKMLGYQTSDLTGNFPYAQLSKFNNLGLDENVIAEKGEYLTREDCVNIFYNMFTSTAKSGAIYGSSLGVTDQSGNVNFDELLSKNISEGFVYDGNLSGHIPFDLGEAVVYLDGEKSDINKINLNDVLYYCENLKEIFAYSNKKIGNISNIVSGTLYPVSVTVSNIPYVVSDSKLSRKMVNEYNYEVGDSVVVLLGMNDELIDIQPVGNIDLTNVGIISACTNVVSGGNVEYTVDMKLVDGTNATYSSSIKFEQGDMALVSVKGGKVNISKIYRKSKDIKYSDFASSVDILDFDGISTEVVYKSRLKDVDLSSEDVLYYELDTQDKVSKLILDDVTKDFLTYGIITDKNEINVGMVINSSYNLFTMGQDMTIGSANSNFNVDEVPVYITFKDGTLDSVEELNELSLIDLNDNNAISAVGTMQFAKGMQVYFKSAGIYHLTTIDEIMKSDELDIKAYVNSDAKISNEIRIIIAK